MKIAANTTLAVTLLTITIINTKKLLWQSSSIVYRNTRVNFMDVVQSVTLFKIPPSSLAIIQALCNKRFNEEIFVYKSNIAQLK